MTAQFRPIRTMAVVFISLVSMVVLAGPAEAKESNTSRFGTFTSTPDVTCVTAMDNPHISSGAGGVIAKLRYCTEDSLSETDDYLYLYLCPNPPTGSESTWKSQGCVITALAHYIIATPVVFTTYT